MTGASLRHLRGRYVFPALDCWCRHGADSLRSFPVGRAGRRRVLSSDFRSDSASSRKADAQARWPSTPASYSKMGSRPQSRACRHHPSRFCSVASPGCERCTRSAAARCRLLIEHGTTFCAIGPRGRGLRLVSREEMRSPASDGGGVTPRGRGHPPRRGRTGRTSGWALTRTLRLFTGFGCGYGRRNGSNVRSQGGLRQSWMSTTARWTGTYPIGQSSCGSSSLTTTHSPGG